MSDSPLRDARVLGAEGVTGTQLCPGVSKVEMSYGVGLGSPVHQGQDTLWGQKTLQRGDTRPEKDDPWGQDPCK